VNRGPSVSGSRKYIDSNVEHELSRVVFRELGDLLGSSG